MQSGFPIIQPTIAVHSTSEPVVQSRCSPVYYSGTKIFNKKLVNNMLQSPGVCYEKKHFKAELVFLIY